MCIKSGVDLPGQREAVIRMLSCLLCDLHQVHLCWMTNCFSVGLPLFSLSGTIRQQSHAGVWAGIPTLSDSIQGLSHHPYCVRHLYELCLQNTGLLGT